MVSGFLFLNILFIVVLSNNPFRNQINTFNILYALHLFNYISTEISFMYALHLIKKLLCHQKYLLKFSYKVNFCFVK